MNIKGFFKRIIPKFALEIYKEKRNLRKKAMQYAHYQKQEGSNYKNDVYRWLEYSKTIDKTDTAEKLISSIIENYHVIEKGFTLSTPIRLGFGQNKIEELINLCELFIDKYGATNDMLLEAIGIVVAYENLHKESNFAINNSLQMKIDHFKVYYDNRYEGKQFSFSKKEYFSKNNSPFDIFSSSRHSLRDFSGEGDIDLSIIEKSIELAQNAPSSCNRQSVRVHVIADKTIVSKALSLQNGNRGFGDRANKLIIVTADLQDWWGGNDRFGPYIDAGIYIMNLLYALHFYKVGACVLNWYAPEDKDIRLREIVGIPEHELITAMIACGLLQDEFKITKSRRRDYKSIMRVIQ